MMRKSMFVAVAATVTLVAMVGSTALAGTIVGVSDLLTDADVTQLETWLGEGTLTLTNVYDWQSGDAASKFHTAADGKGRTFSVYKVNVGGSTEYIGGYNPQSWHSLNSANEVSDPTDRTAFIFNLTDGEKYAHDTSSAASDKVETFNYDTYFPTFGAGNDLCYKTSGSVHSYASTLSYGDGTNVFGGVYGVMAYFTVLDLEVFTIQPAAIVPLPSAAWAGLVLLGTIGIMRRIRRRSSQ